MTVSVVSMVLSACSTIFSEGPAGTENNAFQLFVLFFNNGCLFICALLALHATVRIFLCLRRAALEEKDKGTVFQREQALARIEKLKRGTIRTMHIMSVMLVVSTILFSYAGSGAAALLSEENSNIPTPCGITSLVDIPISLVFIMLLAGVFIRPPRKASAEVKASTRLESGHSYLQRLRSIRRSRLHFTPSSSRFRRSRKSPQSWTSNKILPMSTNIRNTEKALRLGSKREVLNTGQRRNFSLQHPNAKRTRGKRTPPETRVINVLSMRASDQRDISDQADSRK